MTTQDEKLRDLFPLLGTAKQEFDTIKTTYRKAIKTDGLLRSRTALERQIQKFANKYKRDFETLLIRAMATDESHIQMILQAANE